MTALGQNRSSATLKLGTRWNKVGDEQRSLPVLTKNGAIDGNTSFGAFAGSDDNEQHIARYIPSNVDTWHAGLLNMLEGSRLESSVRQPVRIAFASSGRLHDPRPQTSTYLFSVPGGTFRARRCAQACSNALLVGLRLT